MKVLYIAPFFDGTGYSQAAKDYVLALDSVGVDVVPRPIRLNGAKHLIPKRLKELMTKSSSGCNIVIQHTLPHQFDYNGRFEQNIGLFASETSNFSTSSWADHCNNMDKVIVINNQMRSASKVSGITKPIYVVPHASDITRFQRNYPSVPILEEKLKQGNFIFYTIGEMVRRKNYAALLKAFHLEFDPDEPVELVMKVDKPTQYVEEYCESIKKGLKLHRRFYKEEIIISERLTEEEICSLHYHASCFVQSSYGEAWSIPAFDAMAFGKTPIVSRCTGYIDYVSDNEGFLVNVHEEPVFGVENTFEDLYVATETWSSVNISHLRKQMRLAYEDSPLVSKSIAGIKRAYDFSYEVVGQTLKEVLNDTEALERTSR